MCQSDKIRVYLLRSKEKGYAVDKHIIQIEYSNIKQGVNNSIISQAICHKLTMENRGSRCQRNLIILLGHIGAPQQMTRDRDRACNVMSYVKRTTYKADDV